MNINIFYFILSIIGCYIAAFSRYFENINKRNLKYYLWEEYLETSGKELKIFNFKWIKFFSLTTILIISLSFYIQKYILTILIIPIILFFLYQNKLNHFFGICIRYLLEFPKIYFLYLSFGIFPEPFLILIIISIASHFHMIYNWGIIGVDITIFIFNYYFIGLEPFINIIFIIALRLIGVIFFLLPLSIIKRKKEKIKKTFS